MRHLSRISLGDIIEVLTENPQLDIEYVNTEPEICDPVFKGDFRYLRLRAFDGGVCRGKAYAIASKERIYELLARYPQYKFALIFPHYLSKVISYCMQDAYELDFYKSRVIVHRGGRDETFKLLAVAICNRNNISRNIELKDYDTHILASYSNDSNISEEIVRSLGLNSKKLSSGVVLGKFNPDDNFRRTTNRAKLCALQLSDATYIMVEGNSSDRETFLKHLTAIVSHLPDYRNINICYINMAIALSESCKNKSKKFRAATELKFLRGIST